MLENIQTPVLFGIAGRDNMVDNQAIRDAAKRMPNGRVLELPDASHAFWIERDDLRQKWWQAIDAFMGDCHAAFDRKHAPVNDNDKPAAPAAQAPRAKGP